MKKTKLITFLLLCGIVAIGQVRHVKGIKALDISYAKTAFGQAYSLGYVNYFSNKLYGKANLFYEKGENKETAILYSSFGADIFACYKIISFNETVYINALGGLTLASDKQDNLGLSTLGYDLQSAFKYGGLAGIESETFFSDKFALIIGFNQKYLLNPGFGSTRWFGYAAIRFNF